MKKIKSTMLHVGIKQIKQEIRCCILLIFVFIQLLSLFMLHRCAFRKIFNELINDYGKSNGNRSIL